MTHLTHTYHVTEWEPSSDRGYSPREHLQDTLRDLTMDGGRIVAITRDPYRSNQSLIVVEREVVE